MQQPLSGDAHVSVLCQSCILRRAILTYSGRVRPALVLLSLLCSKVGCTEYRWLSFFWLQEIMANYTFWLHAITSRFTKDVIQVDLYLLLPFGVILFGLTLASLYFLHKFNARMQTKFAWKMELCQLPLDSFDEVTVMSFSPKNLGLQKDDSSIDTSSSFESKGTEDNFVYCSQRQ